MNRLNNNISFFFICKPSVNRLEKVKNNYTYYRFLEYSEIFAQMEVNMTKYFLHIISFKDSYLRSMYTHNNNIILYFITYACIE